MEKANVKLLLQGFKSGVKGKFTGSKPYFYAHFGESKINRYDTPPEKVSDGDFCAWGMMVNPKTGKLYVLYQNVEKFSIVSLIKENGVSVGRWNNLIDLRECCHGFFLSKDILKNIYETFPESKTLFEGFSATIAPEKNTLLADFIADGKEEVFLPSGESLSFQEFAHQKGKPASFLVLEDYFNIFFLGDFCRSGDKGNTVYMLIPPPDDIEDYVYVPYVDENVIVAL